MMGPPDAKRSAPGRPTESNACRGGRPDQNTTALTVRPSLRMTDEDRARRLAEARRAIDSYAAAVEAVRLLESVARGPKVHSPRTMARALRELADHFEQAA